MKTFQLTLSCAPIIHVKGKAFVVVVVVAAAVVVLVGSSR